MRLALLADFAVQLLERKLSERHSVFVPPGFSVWMQQSLEPSERLRAFDPEAVVLLLESRKGGKPAVDAASAALAANFPSARLIVPDIEAMAADTGAGFYDERMRTLASMPFSLDALDAIVREIELSLADRKVLALDLDGTLWDGVVGEDGVDAIVPRTGFQRAVRELASRGAVLTAISKNNPADVEPVWNDARMTLSRGDFAAMKINWEAKSENLLALSRELNLPPDAFVFIDDRPVERERMRAALPQVAVPEWEPDSLVQLEGALRRCCTAGGVTDEDRRRGEMYKSLSRRGELAASMTKEEYLSSLGTEIDIHRARPGEAARIAQLSFRTHQFNISGNVYGEDEIKSFIADPGRIVLACCVRDRFGDDGLVGFVHCVGGVIVDFCLSCRAMDRTVEFALEAALERAAIALGMGEIAATVTYTPKNAPVRNLFSRFGFDKITESDTCSEYRLVLAGRSPLSWVGELKGEMG